MVDARIKFRHLQCFLAVAQHGSLQKAADVLAISQPAVSKTLKELEALLAVRLFERGRLGATPTAEGEAFMRHAGASVRALREAVASVSQTRRQSNAVVALGVLPTVAPWLVLPLLKQLDRAASDGDGPAPSLRIETGDNPTLLAQLRRRELDVVVGRFAEPLHMQGLTFEHLYAEPLVLAVRPNHPLRTQAALRADPLAHLSAFTVILPSAGTAIRHTADSFLLARGLGPLHRTLETLSVTVARAYAMQSDAVWVSPLGAALPELECGTLLRLPVDMRGTEEHLGLCLRADLQATDGQHILMQAMRALARVRSEAR